MKSFLAGMVTVLVILSGIWTASSASAKSPTVTGWFGNWVSDSQIDSYIDQSRELSSSHAANTSTPAVFWWKFDGIRSPLCTYSGAGSDCSTSGLTPWTSVRLDSVRKQLQSQGQAVYASYTDVDPQQSGELARLLRNPKKRNALARQLTVWTVKAGVDGVDLDWENFAFHDDRKTWSATSSNLTSFLRNVNKRFSKRGLKLSLTVPAGLRTFSNGTPVNSTGYWVYNWRRNVSFVDQLRIMTYDYSWSTPGPIGPNWWAASVARSARLQVGRQSRKVFLGVPLYGRNWVIPGDQGGLVLSEGCPEGWRPDETPVRSTLTAAQAEAIAAREGIIPSWDPDAAEWHFEYFWKVPGSGGVTCGVKRSVWWGSGDSVAARSAVATGNRLGGVAVWELSQLANVSVPRVSLVRSF